MRLLAISFTFVVIIVLLTVFSIVDDSSDTSFILSLPSQSCSSCFSVMSFNIRLDGHECDPNNHFIKRISRLNTTISSFRPTFLGLQEPFSGQLLHLQSYLPSHYQDAIGYKRVNGHHDLTHASRQNDYQVAILYDTARAVLLEQDYLWLSKTPRAENTKDWESFGARTLNIARFALKDTGVEVIIFNTHIDVKSETARRKQAEIINSNIKLWKSRYPDSIIVLTGDFNSCPGQQAYTLLTRNLTDTWMQCKSSRNCISNDVSSSFHGWLGSKVNTYVFRFIQYVVFTVHGMGFNLPLHVPASFTDLVKLITDSSVYKYEYSISEALPSSLWRFHVDWILYDSTGSSAKVEPKAIWVADVRDGNFSSDHFPLYALFRITEQA